MSLNKRLMSSAPPPSLVASENFKVITYTGNSGTLAITGVGFKPDFVWTKARNEANYSHFLTDSTRGGTKVLQSNSAAAEATRSNNIQSFDADGFTLAGDGTSNYDDTTYVAWCWKAGGGTTASNTDGGIASTVQTNADAGFSIVQGTAAGGTNTVNTFGHGLGVKPGLIILKSRTSEDNWYVYHKSTGAGKRLDLNGNDAASDTSHVWADTEPTTSIFSIKDGQTLTAGATFIAYCFAEISAFSKFGSYIGNGSADGPIVETGFEPAFVMIKNVDSNGQDWRILDNKRNTSNPRNCYLSANNNNAEECQYAQLDFLSNGFKVIGSDGSLNQDTKKMIFMAFAADPDTEAPTLASSFNMETWVGTGRARSINFGMPTDLVWVRERNSTSGSHLYDILRGTTNYLQSNNNNAQGTAAQTLTSFDSNGFSLGTDGGNNQNTQTYVGWTWKADDNEPTIFGGSAVAVYKFEDNANDVAGSFNGTASNVSYVTGYFNKAADFNGSNSFIDVSGITLGDRSMSLWVKFDDVTVSYQTIYDTDQRASSGHSFGDWTLNYYGVNDGAKLVQTWGKHDGSDYEYGTFNFTASNDTWYHIVTVDAPNNHALYINGDKKTYTTIRDAGENRALSSAELTFGQKENTGEALNGQLDQIRIYSGAISDVNVAELYAETASDNDDLNLGGPPETMISANPNAGFSIVRYDGKTTAQKISHGLSAAPNMIIAKNISAGSKSWTVFHSSIGAGKILRLESDGAEITGDAFWGGTSNAPNATTFSVGVNNDNNAENGSAYKIIAYCFHNVSGYQDFGAFNGNGGAQTISLGSTFVPDFIMIKCKSTSGRSWEVHDTRRGIDKLVNINTTDAEEEDDSRVTAVANGSFTLGGHNSVNQASQSFIYWAIAKNVPSNTTLAKSFKTVTWSGNNNANRTISGMGFNPDLLWIKARNATEQHYFYDKLRGPSKFLHPNLNSAQTTDTSSRLKDFNDDGFKLSNDAAINGNNNTYVAWGWKAGNNWEHNITGTIPSIVNANTANGFSIIEYTGTNSNKTIGHGLTSAPEIIFFKKTSGSADWVVGVSDWTKYLELNGTPAFRTQSAHFNNTAPTNSVFSVGGSSDTNASGGGYIAYAFHSVSGYSKIGSYTGDGGNNTGPTVTVGFSPDFLMIKRSNDTGNWLLFDTSRAGKLLFPNESDAEQSLDWVEFLSTGFKLIAPSDADGGTNINLNGSNYIYMAFKEN